MENNYFDNYIGKITLYSIWCLFRSFCTIDSCDYCSPLISSIRYRRDVTQFQATWIGIVIERKKISWNYFSIYDPCCPDKQ